MTKNAEHSRTNSVGYDGFECRLMPMLNQTSTSSESDLRTSVRMVLGAISLKPVDPASKRLTELACRRDLQPRPATVDLRIQFDQAQLGQTFLMINDAATLAHALRANGMPASSQPFMGSRPS